MELPSLRKLSLADLSEANLRSLIDNGEHLFVEFKRQPPKPPNFGAAVASLANTLGGWVLLGVEDKTEKGSDENNRQIVGWSELNPRTDVQSHVASLLQREVDPLPPFVAKSFIVDGKTVVAIRVFESTDSPHIVRGSGALYIRTSKGKEPIESQEGMLALARRAREAEDEARKRMVSTRIPSNRLPDLRAQSQIRLELVAAPLTVTPQLGEWPITGAAARWLRQRFGRGSQIQPEPRGVACYVPVHTLIGIDSAGTVKKTQLSLPPPGYFDLDYFRRDHIRPLLDELSDLLETAEAVGRVIFEFRYAISHARISFAPPIHDPEEQTYEQLIGGALTIPATDEELKSEAARIQREVGRAFGHETWEGEPAK